MYGACIHNWEFVLSAVTCIIGKLVKWHMQDLPWSEKQGKPTDDLRLQGDNGVHPSVVPRALVGSFGLEQMRIVLVSVRHDSHAQVRRPISSGGSGREEQTPNPKFILLSRYSVLKSIILWLHSPACRRDAREIMLDFLALIVFTPMAFVGTYMALLAAETW